jgi:spectinomycin phosphotransferase
MLERPEIRDDQIAACIQHDYGLRVSRIAFLPLGADRDTAVFRVVADDGTPYFLKLRGGIFDETSVALPRFLSDQGIAQIIAPLATRSGQLWADLGAVKTILYPFVAGRNGYEVALSDRHWVELGAALKRIHTAALPPALADRIQQETFSPQWREIAGAFLTRVEADRFSDPVAAELSAFMRAKRDEIADLIGRAERLAQALLTRSPAFVLCHSDVHAGNILIGADDALYIVDWDNPILAPKERDLMFAGGGQGFTGHARQEEELHFYRGYGEAQVDPVALAYYRYERIVQDIAVYCEQLFLSDEGGDDRPQALRHFVSNFRPDGTIAVAYQSDRTQTER